ncbi:MAG TPA: putative metal-binding motif-containing protein [Kofleriaceae bacterium]|nr:putative metal-binding motif-containing protein [Kofleriaceae bacterium]
MKITSVLVLWFATSLVTACTSSEKADDDPGDCTAPQTFYPDSDGDGYGDAAVAGEQHCDAPDGFVARAGDCDDQDAAVHPEATEICDAVDNNCDGAIDDADPAVDLTMAGTFFRDADGDGVGVASETKKACVKPADYAASSGDCDDGAAAIHPGAAEVCDQIDNDCDALVDIDDPDLDTSTAQTFYPDLDHDGYGAGTAMLACNAPSGYVLVDGDCDDADGSSHPGGTELCDGADNDCDGGIDGTAAQPNQCSALVGTYMGSYGHLTQEKLGSTVINSMSCSGTGSASLMLNRTPALQGTFTCVYSGGLTLFSSQQKVTISASVGLDGAVKGTVEHTYNTFDNLKRTYNVTGTQTATGLVLTGTGSWYPNAMSAVPWEVSFSFDTAR